MKIIGRLQEQQELRQCYESGKPEFVAVYGRRRIGKTFLVRQYFNDNFDFYTTGMFGASRVEQTTLFCNQLNKYSKGSYPMVDNWFAAFDLLKNYLSALKKKRILVFIDELPWLDSAKSRFLRALELFWNSWGCMQPRLMLVVCGSATTWMTSKLIGDKGGLHNRLTRSIYLAPFTLGECEQYIDELGVRFNRYEQVENYMIMGGVPYYLSLLKKNLSLSQNIDSLFFSKSAPLAREWDLLFKSLFADSQVYIKVIEAIGNKRKGLTLAEIKKELKMGDGGGLSLVLNNLCQCDFVTKYYPFGKKNRGAIYQLTDPYTLFYLAFLHNRNITDEHLWSNSIDTPARLAWSGYSFEQVCLHHIQQIKKKLGISGILTQVSSWNNVEDDHREQIDLVIDRQDQVINLCEMKYSRAQYALTKQYVSHLNERLEAFRRVTGTTKALHLTMITTYGLKQNKYSGMIQSEVIMSDLFG